MENLRNRKEFWDTKIVNDVIALLKARQPPSSEDKR